MFIQVNTPHSCGLLKGLNVSASRNLGLSFNRNISRTWPRTVEYSGTCREFFEFPPAPSTAVDLGGERQVLSPNCH
jgi:hypothetical protein